MIASLVDLKSNKKPIVLSDFKSLLAMLIPAAGFFVLLLVLARTSDRYAFLNSPSQYPWELVVMVLSGSLAAAGGFSDWLFHRMYVTAGPRERHAHWLALATGGLPLFILMTLASISSNPKYFIIPVVVAGVYTTVLICYDEFLFHWKRCCRMETIFHRMLVFGNAAAWLAWMNWCFVRGF